MDSELGDVSEIEEKYGQGVFGEDELQVLCVGSGLDILQSQSTLGLVSYQKMSTETQQKEFPGQSILKRLDLYEKQVSYQEEYDIYGGVELTSLIQNRSLFGFKGMGVLQNAAGMVHDIEVTKKYVLDFKRPISKTRSPLLNSSKRRSSRNIGTCVCRCSTDSVNNPTASTFRCGSKSSTRQQSKMDELENHQGKPNAETKKSLLLKRDKRTKVRKQFGSQHLWRTVR